MYKVYKSQGLRLDMIQTNGQDGYFMCLGVIPWDICNFCFLDKSLGISRGWHHEGQRGVFIQAGWFILATWESTSWRGKSSYSDYFKLQKIMCCKILLDILLFWCSCNSLIFMHRLLNPVFADGPLLLSHACKLWMYI